MPEEQRENEPRRATERETWTISFFTATNSPISAIDEPARLLGGFFFTSWGDSDIIYELFERK